MSRTLLIATALLLGWVNSGPAENATKSFQFSSHGISVLIGQGRKFTVPDGNPVELGKPGTMTCVGPLDCMITIQAMVASDRGVRVCTYIDGTHARGFCRSCIQTLAALPSSTQVMPGAHVIQTKASVCNGLGGTIYKWEIDHTLYDPNVTQ